MFRVNLKSLFPLRNVVFGLFEGFVKVLYSVEWHEGVLNDQLVRMWKKEVVTYF
jgi:hypothetical protein